MHFSLEIGRGEGLLTSGNINVAIAFAALLVALVSIKFTRDALRAQIRHNKLSVRPIPSIDPLDYEDCIEVSLANRGVGPMIVKKIVCSREGIDLENLVGHMADMDVEWDDFFLDLVEVAISAGEQLSLLKLSQRGEDSEEYCRTRDACRSILKHVTIRLEYTDIYDQDFDPVIEVLDLYSRHGN